MTTQTKIPHIQFTRDNRGHVYALARDAELIKAELRAQGFTFAKKNIWFRAPDSTYTAIMYDERQHAFSALID